MWNFYEFIVSVTIHVCLTFEFIESLGFRESFESFLKAFCESFLDRSLNPADGSLRSGNLEVEKNAFSRKSNTNSSLFHFLSFSDVTNNRHHFHDPFIYLGRDGFLKIITFSLASVLFAFLFATRSASVGT